MRLLKFILCLLLLAFAVSATYGQGVINFGASRAQDTGLTKGQLRASALSNTDPAKFLTVDSRGLFKLETAGVIALSNTFVVNSLPAMLALSASVGDVCVRTDSNITFILRVQPPSSYDSWVQLLTQNVTLTNGYAVNVSGAYPYFVLTADSSLLATRLRVQKQIDSVAALSGGGSVTSVAAANNFGISWTGSPITTVGTLTPTIDTVGLATRLRVQKGIDSLAEIVDLKLYAADTANLSNRIDRKQDTTISTVDHKVLLCTTVERELRQIDSILLTRTSTGVEYGGIGTVNGGINVGTNMDYTGGRGTILNNSNPSFPTYHTVTWTGATNVPLTSYSSVWVYFYVDSNSTVQQTTIEPTRENYRTNLWLFKVGFAAGAIRAVQPIEVPITQIAPTLKDLNSAMGPIRISGMAPAFNGANMFLNITSGTLYNFGVNVGVNPIDPNVPAFPEFNSSGSSRFRYSTTSGTVPADSAQMDFTNYQVGGVVTPIPGAATRVTIQYVLANDQGIIRVLYGNEFYTSVADALVALSGNDPYASAPSFINSTNSFVLGAVIAPKNATDLSTEATFVVTNKFFAFGGSALSTAGGAFMLTDFSNASGTNAATSGGTGQSTYATGDMLYSSATNTLSKLSGNTTTTKQFLTQTGTGAASQAPEWGGIAVGDLPSTVLTNNNTNTVTNKRFQPRVNTAANYTTSVTLDFDNYDLQTITAQAGALLFNAPTWTATEGEVRVIRIKDNGTARALTWNAIFRGSTTLALPSTTTLGKVMYMQFIYNSTDTKIDLVGLSDGY